MSLGAFPGGNIIINIIINLDGDISYMRYYLIMYLAVIQIYPKIQHICRFTNSQPLEAYTRMKKKICWDLHRREGAQSNLCIRNSSTCRVNPRLHQQEAVIKLCPEEVQWQLQVVRYYTTMPNLQARWYLHQRQRNSSVKTQLREEKHLLLSDW